MEQSPAARGRRRPGPLTLYPCVLSQAGAASRPPRARGFERVLQPQSPALSIQRPLQDRGGVTLRAAWRRARRDAPTSQGARRAVGSPRKRGAAGADAAEPPAGARPARAGIWDLRPPELRGQARRNVPGQL